MKDIRIGRRIGVQLEGKKSFDRRRGQAGEIEFGVTGHQHLRDVGYGRLRDAVRKRNVW